MIKLSKSRFTSCSFQALIINCITAFSTFQGKAHTIELITEIGAKEVETTNHSQTLNRLSENMAEVVSQSIDDLQALIDVKVIEIIGSTIFSDVELKSFIQPVEGRTVSLEEIQEVAAKITSLYQEKGYITSQAVVLEQPLDDGIVKIQVIEGSLSTIDIQGLERLNEGYIRSRLSLAEASPFNVVDANNQLQLLGLSSLFDRVETTLEAGESAGESKLTVLIDEASPFFGALEIDNNSPPSVGGERYGIALGYRNLSGIGDSLSVDFSRTFSGGSTLWDIAYQVPVSPRDGSVQVRAAFSNTRLTESPLDELEIEGQNESYEVTWREPLKRTLQEEFALSLSFGYQNGRTFTFDRPTRLSIGADEEGETRTSVFRFGQDYVRRDRTGVWGIQSQFSIGTSLFNATENSNDVPDGQFVSWQGQVQRLQRLGDNNLLVIEGALQLAFNSLLPSEQFLIGGVDTLRGYRKNIRSGDNGFRFSVEDRITLSRDKTGDSTLQIFPFLDLGTVWNNEDNPNFQPSQTFLASIGTGVLWQPLDGLDLRLDYGLSLVNVDDSRDNLQDDGLHFSIGYRF